MATSMFSATGEPLYALSEAVIKAKHVLDPTDMIEFTCTNITDFSVTAFDESTPAWTLSAGLFGHGCAKTVTGPGGIIGLIVACVQGAVLIILGPALMMYGPSLPRFMSLIQAVIVSSYILLINSLVSINPFTAFLVFERAVTLVISTLTVTFASVNNKGAKAKAAGFALGSLLATPLMTFASELIYTRAIGCKKFGEKTDYFPNGEPLGCDLHSVNFQLVFQLSLFFKWCIITLSAYYGQRTINFSTATAGATMSVKGIIDLSKAIGFQVAPEYAATIIAVITPVRTWVMYGVAIVGFLLQRVVLEEVTEEPNPEKPDDPPKKKMVQKKNQPKIFSLFCGLLIGLCATADAFLGRHLETLKDGGKGAMVRALTRKPTKSPAKGESKTPSKDIESAKDEEEKVTPPALNIAPQKETENPLEAIGQLSARIFGGAPREPETKKEPEVRA